MIIHSLYISKLDTTHLWNKYQFLNFIINFNLYKLYPLIMSCVKLNITSFLD
jgi:hypothetical protein